MLPLELKAALGIGTLAAALIWAQVALHRHDAGVTAKCRAEVQQAITQQIIKQRADEQAAAFKTQGVVNDFHQQITKEQTVTASTRAELERLRLNTVRPGASASSPTAASGVDEARAIVGECATALVGLDEAARSISAQLTALQAWVLANP